MQKLTFHTTGIGTRILTCPGQQPWELGSIIKNKKERWKATHKARKVTTYHATLDLAKAWLVTLESTGVDRTQLAPKPDTATPGVTLDKEDVGEPTVDPQTGATYVPMPGGGVQVIPVPQPLVVWRTWMDTVEEVEKLADRALATGLAAQSSAVQISARFATEEDGILDCARHQLDLVTTMDQVPLLEALLSLQASYRHPGFVVLPVLEAPTFYAAWLRRHSTGFAPDAVPKE